MPTFNLHPDSDIGPNGGTPFPGSPTTLWDKIDDDPTNDGDTTRINNFIAPIVNVFRIKAADIAAIPGGDIISKVDLKWAMRGDSSTFASVGFRIGGTYYYAVAHSIGPGSYTTVIDTFLLDPSTSLAWTKAGLTAAAFAATVTVSDDPPTLGVPRLSQLIAIVTSTSAAGAGNVSGAASSTSQRGKASVSIAGLENSGGSAAASGTAERASADSLAPGGSATGTAQGAAASSLAPEGSVSRTSQSGAGTSIAGCTATVESLAPKATPTSLAPTGAASRLNDPEGGVS